MSAPLTPEAILKSYWMCLFASEADWLNHDKHTKQLTLDAMSEYATQQTAALREELEGEKAEHEQTKLNSKTGKGVIKKLEAEMEAVRAAAKIIEDAKDTLREELEKYKLGDKLLYGISDSRLKELEAAKGELETCQMCKDMANTELARIQKELAALKKDRDELKSDYNEQFNNNTSFDLRNKLRATEELLRCALIRETERESERDQVLDLLNNYDNYIKPFEDAHRREWNIKRINFLENKKS